MSEERTLHRTGEFRVTGWVQRETYGMASALEFGCGVGVYTRAMLSEVRAGIDAFEPYITEATQTPENAGCEFFLGDMRQYRDHIPRWYEMALFVDSLEHLTMDDAINLIDRCKSDFLKIALFVPIGTHEQGPCDDNPLQSHLSTWSEVDLELLGFDFKVQDDFHHNNPAGKQAAAFATWTRV